MKKKHERKTFEWEVPFSGLFQSQAEWRLDQTRIIKWLLFLMSVVKLYGGSLILNQSPHVQILERIKNMFIAYGVIIYLDQPKRIFLEMWD